MTDKALLRELGEVVEALAFNLERLAPGNPVVSYAKAKAARALAADGDAAPAAPPPASGELEALMREYLTTPFLPHRVRARYRIEELLGVGDAKERAERMPKVQKDCDEVDASMARFAAKRAASVPFRGGGG